MSFLFPSVLWGLLASLIPLIIHLVSQRAATTIDFPSIQHIKALEGESIKKLRIIQWLLILIRTLIIICLVLMCSGPIMLNNSIWISSAKES
ncbi:MAG: BatA domain-containing protein, partial [Candidatus Marinimicrobia bacterium]|nr:BatA domain-containing protein [Candidatus Neomarinimicrobiota bacterium]